MEVIGVIIVFSLILTLYFLPSFVAIGRDHHQTTAIAILNLFLGWTLLGWILALVWAATAVQKEPQ
ncbi:MAG: superinfection immunity protein [Burkholderiaceae bacterium]